MQEQAAGVEQDLDLVEAVEHAMEWPFAETFAPKTRSNFAVGRRADAGPGRRGRVEADHVRDAADDAGRVAPYARIAAAASAE